MAIFNGTAANNNFAGTAADDVFNYGNVTFSGSTVTGVRGTDTITSGGGFDRLSFANLGIDYCDVQQVGNDLFFHIYPTTSWDATTPFLGGVKVTDFFASDGNGVIDRVDFSDVYALLSYSGGIFRATVYNPADVVQWRSASGSPGNDVLNGSAVTDNLNGRDGNDTLSGLGGNDDLEGDAGNDRLLGGAGADDLFGDIGNDTLIGGIGNDTMSGSDGIDTVEYSTASGPVQVNLQQFSGKDLGSGTSVGIDTIYFVERVIGSPFNDQLVGNGAFAVTLNGGAGNDSLAGSAVNDSLLGGAGADFFNASASGSTVGGLGNDTMDGGVVTDLYNYLDGNTVSYASSNGNVTVNLQTGTAFDGVAGTDTLRNFNFVYGSSFNDTLTGSTRLQFESFIGGAGDDRIDGGALTDTLNQMNGNRAEFNTLAAAVTVDLAAGTATGQGNDTLININHVRGSSLADTLRGSDRADYAESFEGMGSNDVLDGRGGFDVVRYQYAANGVNVSLAAGTGIVSGTDQDTFTNMEGIRGSHYNDTLTGGNAANAALEVFLGNGGNDLIDGAGGYDRVDYVNAVQGVVVTLGGTADGSATDGLPILAGQIRPAGTPGATIGTDTLRRIEAVRGSDFNDTLTGSNIATLEVFEGRKGNDLIDGNGGLDRAGYFQATAGVVATLGQPGTDGTAADGYGTTDTLRDIENLQGSRDFADKLTGNQLANLLDGQGGNDTLSGGSGADTLLGGGGADLLLGGNGNDLLTGNAGLDLFRFTGVPNASSNTDRITDFVAADDTIQLDDAGFVGIGGLGALSAGAFRAGTAAADASDRVIYDSATGKLYFDADGNGAGAQVLFATLTAGTALTVTDFVIV